MIREASNSISKGSNDGLDGDGPEDRNEEDSNKRAKKTVKVLCISGGQFSWVGSSPCEVCGKGFVYKAEQQRHMNWYHPARIHESECKTCVEILKRSGNMPDQPGVHESPRFDCLHCANKLTHQSNLKRHVRTEHYESSDKKTYDYSGEGSSIKMEGLNEEGEEVNDGSAIPWKLKTLMKTRATTTLRRCMMEWKLAREACRYYGSFCGGCGQTYKLGKNVVNHVRLHMGIKPNQCGTCGKRFGVSL